MEYILRRKEGNCYLISNTINTNKAITISESLVKYIYKKYPLRVSEQRTLETSIALLLSQ